MFESISAGFAYVIARFSPQIIAAFLTALFSYAVPLVTKVVSVLGVSTITMVGIHSLSQTLSSNVEGYFNGLPADVLAIVGIMKLDMAFSLISSAMLVKWTLKGWDKAQDSVSSTQMKLPPPDVGE